MGSFSCRSRQRLIIRSLESLGIFFPLASHSHSLNRRQQNVDLQSRGDIQMLAHLLLTSESDGRTPSVPNLSDIIRMYELFAFSTESLRHKHMVAFKFGFDSEFNFAIRMVENLIASIRKNPNRLVSSSFSIELHCVLIHLLVDRWNCSHSLNKQGGMVSSQLSSLADVEWVRSSCRSIIESTIELCQMQSEGDQRNTPSPIGSFEVWAAYLQAEQFIQRKLHPRDYSPLFKVRSAYPPVTVGRHSSE